MEHQNQNASAMLFGFRLGVWLSFWKARAATRIRVGMLVLLGLGALLLPTLGSAAQTADIQAWQKDVKNAPPSGLGCFTADYPNTQWKQVSCNDQGPENIVFPGYPQIGIRSYGIPPFPIGNSIGNYGYSASAVGGPIWGSEGSFNNVAGVTNIMDSDYGSNQYSLQMNTDYFSIPGGDSVCNNNSGCTGWVQFAFQNYLNSGNVSIWYWVRGANSCPTGWMSSGDWCYINKSQYVPLQSISAFNDQVSLRGETVNGMDTVILVMGGASYALNSESFIKILPQIWQTTQFNVFGLGEGSTAIFNDGSALTIKTVIDNGTTNSPSCLTSVSTGEENNLNYNSPCCPSGGTQPSIVFAEGTDDNPNKYSCADLKGSATYTVSSTYGTGGIISPYPSVSVAPGGTYSFTVTPASGYKIASVSGCGGAFTSGGVGSATASVYKTGVINAGCNVSATFAVNTYTVASCAGTNVTACAGGGGTISPAGAVAVSSGATKTYTLTPSTGYRISSVTGTCGGTLSGNTFTTKPITAACTVVANFVDAYTVTSCAGTNVAACVGGGGTISPAGVVGVSSGATRTYTLTPSTGYKISSVTGTCGGTLSGNTYTIKPITAACTVVANFVAVTYTVTSCAGTNVAACVGGGGTINPAGAVSSGATKTYTLTPSTGYKISSVTGTCGGTLSGNTYTTKAITANCTVVANFVAATTYTVTSSAGTGGSISPASAAVTLGGTYSFTVTPASGYKIASVSGCSGAFTSGGVGSTTASVFRTGAVNAACTVTATFTAASNYYTVSASVNGTGGTASPASQQVSEGGSVKITFTANAGYGFPGLSGGGILATCGTTSVSTSGSTMVATVGPINANCNYIAAFPKQ